MTYQDYAPMFKAATEKYGLPAGLLPAVAENESGFNPKALSPAGASGLMQFMPGTARGYGINPLDPRQAIDGAARYFKHLLTLFRGDKSKAIAGYNAGEGAVQKYGGIPPYAETQKYVKAVLGSMAKYAGPGGIVTSPADDGGALFGIPRTLGGVIDKVEGVPGALTPDLPSVDEIGATLTKVAIVGTAVLAGAGLVLLGVNKATGNPLAKTAKLAI